MKVCVIGCVHGEIDDMYRAVEETEAKMGSKVDVVLCCGDFQAVRNEMDLETMACPLKYRSMNTFYKYYSGERVAPVLTIFIGGNHEASNHLQELPYGGWVAPNIYYLGIAGCIKLGNTFTVCGLSGIYDRRDVNKGRFEAPPYDRGSERSVYHVRQFDANKLFLLPGGENKRVDCFLSHDWPNNVVPRGAAKTEQLLRKKPFFREDVDKGELGSPILRDLLCALRPKYWFAAHLHVKFATEISEAAAAADEEMLLLEDEAEPRTTKFLALDKIVKGRDFLQIIDMPSSSEEGELELHYDLDWLAIIKATHEYTPTNIAGAVTASAAVAAALDLKSAQEFCRAKFEANPHLLRVPKNFQRTASVYGNNSAREQGKPSRAQQGNPQLDEFYALLELNHIHPFTVPYVPPPPPLAQQQQQQE